MTLVYALLVLLSVAGFFFTGLGLFTVIMWFKPVKPPSDPSNKLNNIASWWIGLTKPHVMGKAFKYFRQDVEDNILDVERNND